MTLNRYEYSKIPNEKLPAAWQSQTALDDLLEFLQQNWEQRSAFYEDGSLRSQQQFLDFLGFGGLRTKKYVGTIAFRGEQLNIFPKVFSTDKDDHETGDLDQKHLLNNLIKWVEYSNKLNYPFINISSELRDTNDLRELFVSLYLRYVRSATERGLYYQYVEKTEDGTIIKGKLDVKDYYVKKIPSYQANKFLCSYSKFEFDNKVNRIIKYTCRKLLDSATQKNIGVIRAILTKLNEVSDVQCKPSDCDNIRLGKLHKNYGIIISMSKMLLLNEVSDYTLDDSESFCFLFPTDLLFEGFIGGFMKEVLSEIGGKVTLQESKSSLVNRIIFGNKVSGAAFTLRRDIVVEINGKVFILDTKYKEMTRFEGNEHYADVINDEAKQGDLYQVIVYASKAGLKDVYLLYPMYRYEDAESAHPIAESDFDLFGAKIYIHFVRMPFVFENDNEEHVKKQLTAVIKSIFEISD